MHTRCLMGHRMKALELKIPPPVVAIVAAGAMWGVGLVTPLIQVPAPVRLLAAALIAAVGLGTALAGVISFRRARTTVNPMKPEMASSLVTTGIFQFTRNPMYVGLVFVLVAWGISLSSAWALIGPFAFVAYISRFQIAPEERALSVMFGASYAAYKAKVRRWL